MTSSERSPCLLMAAAILLSVSGCMSARVQSPQREEVLDVDTPSVFLTCAPDTLPRVDRKRIGPGGGRLQSGNSELNIPRSAVSATRAFTFEQGRDNRVGVTVNRTVPPVHFARTAVMFIDLSRCGTSDIGNVDWHVWRMDSTGVIGQKLRTSIAGNRARTFIDSTSVYMIAN